MRTTILLLSTIFLLAFGFSIYWIMQGTQPPPPPAAAGGPSTVMPALPASGSGVIGAGEGAWYETYDRTTGLRKSRIRWERYEPEADGQRVRLTHPEAEFFLRNGEVLHIAGETGRVLMQAGLQGNEKIAAGMNRTPTSGEMKQVTLRIVPKDATVPTLTMTMDNASFDNEKFRITTEAYVQDGKLTPADQVPVKVRGEDYDFDGRGLTMEYNEVDRRLTLMKIAHGQRLLIKHPGRLLKSEPGAGEPGAWAPGLPIPGIMLAAADPSAVGEAGRGRRGAPRAAQPAPARATAEDGEPTVYLAIFKDAVEVFQGGQKMADADQMHVQFLSEGDELEDMDSTAATQPGGATRPAALRAAGQRSPGGAKSRSAGGPPTGSGTADTGTAKHRSPATAQAQEPIEIHWTGPLTVTPVPGEIPQRLAPGEQIIKLIGAPGRPVHLTGDARQARGELNAAAPRVRTDVTCATLTYWTIDQGAMLVEGQNLPVDLSDSRGMHIVTHSMIYSRADLTAQLFGPSTARLPAQDDSAPPASGPGNLPPAEKKMMDVAWSDRCTLSFEPGGMEQMAIRSADLEGHVKVDHPDMKMNADALRLMWASGQSASVANDPANRPSGISTDLKQVDARGQVKCVMNDPADPTSIKKIDCDSLTLMTARGTDGRLYPRDINAVGNVKTSDSQQTMTARTLLIELAEPTTRPSTRPAGKADVTPGELKNLVAQQPHVVTTDGKTIDADTMVIEVKDLKKIVTLTGQNAVLTWPDGSLSGPLISAIPDTKDLKVIGAGKLTGVQRPAPGAPARPVEVTWMQSLVGHGDVVECAGGVEARTVDADGAVNVARGDRVFLTTMDRPTTQPAGAQAGAAAATQPAPAQKAAKAGRSRPGSEFDDVMADRVIKSISLEGSPRTTSVLTDKLGAELRRVYVEAEKKIQFFQNDPQHGRLVVPSAGKLLFIDNRPPDTQPSAQEAAADPMGLRGSTAFSWTESLTYDQASEQVVMSGGVVMGRLEQGQANVPPLNMTGEKLTADIARSPDAATQPADAAGGLAGDFSKKMQLKHVRVEGGVHITSPAQHLNVEAQQLDYDPVTHVLTLTGTDRQPVRQLDEKGLEQMVATELRYNTQTGQLLKVAGGRSTIRK